MNDTPATKQPDQRIRALVWMILCMLAYLAVITATYFLFFQRGDWRSGVGVFGGLCVITYLLAIVALFKPHRQ
jgi:uncharacterized membrane protein